jgi:hypothetical protein
LCEDCNVNGELEVFDHDGRLPYKRPNTIRDILAGVVRCAGELKVLGSAGKGTNATVAQTGASGLAFRVECVDHTG